jgi:hypothetical protein
MRRMLEEQHIARHMESERRRHRKAHGKQQKKTSQGTWKVIEEDIARHMESDRRRPSTVLCCSLQTDGFILNATFQSYSIF